MKNVNHFKYLVCSDRDLLWGMIVDNVGHADIDKNYKVYPPKTGHPTDYYFTTQNGRLLDNYQIVYISKGKGFLRTSSSGKEIPITAGDMIIIPPYTWHSYYPNREYGWQEYWIGMRGPHLDARYKNGFFGNRFVYKAGIREEIVLLFNQAINLAFSEQSTYQQTLAGIGNLILGLAIYYDSNLHFSYNPAIEQINQARIIMRENYLSGISPEEVAKQIHMGYSWFRKLFKEYTNVSPSLFILELKLQKAKSLLLNTTLSVKEISYQIGYDNATYFTALFKKHTGLTPLAYRGLNASNPPSETSSS